MNVENLQKLSNADAHAGLVDKVVDDRLRTCGGQLHLRQGGCTYKRGDGPLSILVRAPYPDKSDQE